MNSNPNLHSDMADDRDNEYSSPSQKEDQEENSSSEDIKSPVSIQEDDNNSSSPSLIHLLKSYSSFIHESTHVNLDMNKVINDLAISIQRMKPPHGSSERMIDLWTYLLDFKNSDIESYSESLRNLPSSVQYEVLKNTEKLNLKLAMEFEQELARGKKLGIMKSDTNF